MNQITNSSNSIHNRARKQHKSGGGSPRGNVGTEQKTEKRYTRVPTINFAGHDCSIINTVDRTTKSTFN